MIRLCVIIFFLSLQSCNSGDSLEKENFPPNVILEDIDKKLKNSNGIWLFKGELFNGYIIEKDSSVIIAKLPIIKGKEHGLACGWYTSGELKYHRHFVSGNREGVHKGWYKNGNVSFEYFFKNDKYEGEQLTFFENGQKWQSLNYVNGYEEGKQKSWNENGRVVNNFTVKNRKLYGVIGRFDCMSVQKN